MLKAKNGSQEVLAIINVTDKAVSALTLDDTDIDIVGTATQDVTATATPSSESSKTKWEIMDTAVATISGTSGAAITVTGVAAGQTVLKASCGGKEAYAIVTVTE